VVVVVLVSDHRSLMAHTYVHVVVAGDLDLGSRYRRLRLPLQPHAPEAQRHCVRHRRSRGGATQLQGSHSSVPRY